MAFFQTKHVWVNPLAEGVAALMLDGPGKANLLTPAFLADLDRALDEITAAGQFELLLVQTGKAASFCHGIDPALWTEMTRPDEFAALAQQGQNVCAKLAG